MMTASNIHYEISDRIRAIAPGGIGAIHLLARKIGLIDDIDLDLHLLKRHLPYHESDHVLNIAYNLLAGITERPWFANSLCTVFSSSGIMVL
jgi:hypothetical protein